MMKLKYSGICKREMPISEVPISTSEGLIWVIALAVTIGGAATDAIALHNNKKKYPPNRY